MKEESAIPSVRSFRQDKIAWAICLSILFLSLLVWHFWSHREVIPHTGSRAIVSEYPRIVVLAYDRVADERDGKHVDRTLFREHLETLRSGGFTPITLKDLSDFYHGNAPLPPNPVVLTFDHGYLETYNNVDPILREIKWPAVMFLTTSRQRERHT